MNTPSVDDEHHTWLASMDAALQRVDDEGPFGAGAGAAPCCDDAPDHSNVDFARRRLNPPGPLSGTWLTEAAESI